MNEKHDDKKDKHGRKMTKTWTNHQNMAKKGRNNKKCQEKCQKQKDEDRNENITNERAKRKPNE